MNGDKRFQKLYKEHGKWNYHPLPYAVRNILAHSGKNTNTLDEHGEELRSSIRLLRSWVTIDESVPGPPCNRGAR